MMNSQVATRKKVNVKRMTIISLLSAISIMLSMIPQVGYIQIGPVAITTMCIPVIIGGIMEGPIAGASIGFIFGVTSMFRALMGLAGPTGFVFMNPLYTASFSISTNIGRHISTIVTVRYCPNQPQTLCCLRHKNVIQGLAETFPTILSIVQFLVFNSNRLDTWQFYC